MQNRLRGNSSIISAFAILFLSGCATIYNPATQREERLLIDTKSEVALGRDMDKDIQNRLVILKDTQMQKRLDGIGRKVSYSSDRQDLIYYFRIVKDKEANAFAIPAGFIYVNSGLINIANEDELAGVLAHEIGHIAARHSVKKLEAAMGYQIIMAIALGISGKKELGEATDIVFNLANLGYSRQDELLADRLAVKYTRKSGFSPYGMLTFLEKLKKHAASKGPNFNLVFLSSHPPIQERIRNVEEAIRVNP